MLRLISVAATMDSSCSFIQAKPKELDFKKSKAPETRVFSGALSIFPFNQKSLTLFHLNPLL